MNESMCECSTKHVPDPHIFFITGDYVLCPTASENLKSLRRYYEMYDGNPPGHITKHYGKFIRKIAKELESK